MQNQEHTCFFRFQSELHESLTPLQFAKALALKNITSVSIWSMLDLLTSEGSRPNGMLEVARAQTAPLQAKEGPLVSMSAVPASDHQTYTSLPPLDSIVTNDGSQDTSGTSSGESRTHSIILDTPVVHGCAKASMTCMT